MSFYRCLLQRLAFSKSRHFNREKDPTNTMAYDNAYTPGVGLHGGRRMTLTAMIDRCEKLHRAGNLVSWPYSSKFTATTATHYTTMMYPIGGREEATNLAWRLP